MLSQRFYGVTVSTLDFESSDPSSNLGRTSSFPNFSIVKPCHFAYFHSISRSHIAFRCLILDNYRYNLSWCLLCGLFFREQHSLVDEFTLELLIAFVDSLSLAHYDSKYSDTLKSCTQVTLWK